MRKTSILMALLLFQGLSGILWAQDQYGGLEIGGFAAWGFRQDRTFQVGPPQSSPPIDLGFEYDDKLAGGVRFNFLSRRYWGGEVDYSYEKNTATLTRRSYTPVLLDGGVHQFFYNTVFYPRRYGSSSVMPFATGGVGLAAYQLSSETRARAADPRIYGLGDLRSIDKRFAFNYGGGVKAEISSHFGVRADFRHVFSDVPSYGLPKESSNPAQTVLPIQGKLQTYQVSVGFYFHALK